MSFRRALRPAIVLSTSLACVVALAAAAVSAQAADAISPPTITASSLGGIGPYAVGSTVTFTFTEEGAGPAVGYQYTLNGGPAEQLSAPSGSASLPVVVPLQRTNVLTAYAVAADGTVSAGTQDTFLAYSPTPAADKDLNGDGTPDLLTVGETSGLAPGLWLATGKTSPPGAARRGRLTLPATDIGINGNGSSPGAGSPSEFDGAQAITGLFAADGFQDILIYYPSGSDAGGGAVLAGSGDGTALDPISGNVWDIASGDLSDLNGDNPLQVVNAYGSIYGTGLPDLLAINGDPVNGYYLDYYAATTPGGYFNTFSIRTPTPDGTDDWNQWTLATLSYSGGIGIFLWNESTGALYFWAGVTFTDNGNSTGTISYTQYEISGNFYTGQPLSTLQAAEFDGRTIPDLWAVTPAGVATAYIITKLETNGAAKVKVGKPQSLS
jgi:hypothetical protein